MKKHIYLYTSNLETTKTLRDDLDFKAPFEYTHDEIQKSLQNEYGRIETKQNYYHILLGRLPQNGCPWCGTEPELIKIKESGTITHSKYCFICPSCEARGPSLNISRSAESCNESMEHYKYLMTHRFKYRRPWDVDFVNPYENEQLPGTNPGT